MLRGIDLGEADRVLTVLTPHLGKLKVIAKGIRRPRSRIGGGLEPLGDVDLVLAMGRTFDVVTQSAVRDPHLGLRDDLHATAAGWYLVELADRFCEERAESAAAFDLLGTGAGGPRHRARQSGRATRWRAGTSSACSRSWATGPSSRCASNAGRSSGPRGTATRPRPAG